MNKKAPDTRNKLDNNKDARNTRIIKPIKKSHNSHPKTFGDLKKIIDKPQQDTVNLKPKSKISNGVIYKKIHGHSKTQKRLMKKYSTDLEGLKIKRKTRKKAEKVIRQDKHKASKIYKRTNVKNKGSKGSTPASKIKNYYS